MIAIIPDGVRGVEWEQLGCAVLGESESKVDHDPFYRACYLTIYP
jgi:hypothetical protein